MLFAASDSKGSQAQRWQFHGETEDRIEQGMCLLLEILKWEITSLHPPWALKSLADPDVIGGGHQEKVLRPRNGRLYFSLLKILPTEVEEWCLMV